MPLCVSGIQVWNSVKCLKRNRSCCQAGIRPHFVEPDSLTSSVEIHPMRVPAVLAGGLRPPAPAGTMDSSPLLRGGLRGRFGR